MNYTTGSSVNFKKNLTERAVTSYDKANIRVSLLYNGKKKIYDPDDSDITVQNTTENNGEYTFGYVQVNGISLPENGVYSISILNKDSSDLYTTIGTTVVVKEDNVTTIEE